MLTLLVVAIVVLAALAVVGRPLLLASLDPEVARARGVPVRALDVGFLLMLGLAVAATSQITGALLVFALLVAPPAAAQALTPRPGLSLVLSVAFCAARDVGGAWASPTSRSTRSDSSSPRSRSACTCSRKAYAAWPFAAPAARGHRSRSQWRDARRTNSSATRYLAGTFVALACGLVGWFTVLRGQVFAGDALSHVAFVGAIAAAVVGVDERVGLFALTLGAGGGDGGTGPARAGRRRDDRGRVLVGARNRGAA